MNLSSKPATRRVASREIVKLGGRRSALSYALPALASSAVWLFLTVGIPAGEMQPAQRRAPLAAAPTVPTSQASPAWPEPAVRDDAVALAEPAPTF